MNYCIQKQVGEHLYRVYFDEDTSYFDECWLKDDEELKEQINRGEYAFWGVERLSKCSSCDSWHDDREILWGMLFMTPEEAIEEYIHEVALCT